MEKKPTKENDGIDFVVPWVDDQDEAWRERRSRYRPDSGSDIQAARYRDWGLLRYQFRGFEKFSPWVRKIWFVTDCRVPAWLNAAHPKLEIVDPNSLLPADCVPTFNINAIELNIHRIPGLSEQFVYFNDDMYLLRTTGETDFFLRGLPCDSAALSPVIVTKRKDVGSIMVNDMCLINQHFSKPQVVHAHPLLWFNPRYGAQLLRTLFLLPWRHLPGFYNHHLPQPYLKSIFREVWDKEEAALAEVTRHRFRNYYADLNQWLFRYWQLCSGRFSPAPVNRGFYITADDVEKTCRLIRQQAYHFLCINDAEDIEDIASYRDRIREAFEQILPEKSDFEL